jgi:hypothetical protein
VKSQPSAIGITPYTATGPSAEITPPIAGACASAAIITTHIAV